MTDKERLEEIKEEVESLRGDMYVHSIETETSADIILDDMEWLIERAQELEEQLQGLHKMYDIRLAKSDEFEEQNKRYREALGNIANIDGYFIDKPFDMAKALELIDREARKALESESE